MHVHRNGGPSIDRLSGLVYLSRELEEWGESTSGAKAVGEDREDRR